jgi:hypothetical protein
MSRKMMRLLFCLVICVLFCSTSIFTRSKTRNSSLLSQDEPQGSFADLLKYKRLFARISVHEQVARSREAQGLDAGALRQKIPQALGLAQYEAQVLLNIVSGLSANVAALDQRANDIIRLARVEQTKRLMQGLDRLPHAPPELKALQQQKDGLYLQAKNDLRNALGTVRFEEMTASLDSLLDKNSVKLTVTFAKPAR